MENANEACLFAPILAQQVGLTFRLRPGLRILSELWFVPVCAAMETLPSNRPFVEAGFVFGADDVQWRFTLDGSALLKNTLFRLSTMRLSLEQACAVIVFAMLEWFATRPICILEGPFALDTLKQTYKLSYARGGLFFAIWAPYRRF